MKLYQFKLLSNQEQDAIIHSAAVFLGERSDPPYLFKLYQLDEFYIEEMWHQPFNERRGISSFISIERLQPYLEVIDISALKV